MADNNKDTIYVKKASTGQTWGVKDQAELDGALAAGLQVVDSKEEHESLRLKDRGLEITKEGGPLTGVGNFGKAALRSSLDMATAPAKILGADIRSGGELVSSILGTDSYDDRALADVSSLSSGLGGIAPDLALLAGTAGLGSALKGASTLTRVGAELAADTITGGLAGAQVADEQAWRATGEGADTEQLRSDALTGALFGGGLGAAGQGASALVKRGGALAKRAAEKGFDVGDSNLAREVGGTLIQATPTGSARRAGAGASILTQAKNRLNRIVTYGGRSASREVDNIASGISKEMDVLGKQRGTAAKRAGEFSKAASKDLEDVGRLERNIAKADLDYNSTKARQQRSLRTKNKIVDERSAGSLKKIERQLEEVRASSQNINNKTAKAKEAYKNIEAGDGYDRTLRGLRTQLEKKVTKQKELIEKAAKAKHRGAEGRKIAAENKLSQMNEELAGVSKLASERKQKLLKEQSDKIANLERESLEKVNTKANQLQAKMKDLEAEANLRKKQNARLAGDKIQESKETAFQKKRDFEDDISSKRLSAEENIKQKDVYEAAAKEADETLQRSAASQREMRRAADEAAEFDFNSSFTGRAIDIGTAALQGIARNAFRMHGHAIALAPKDRLYGGWNYDKAINGALDAVVDGSDYTTQELKPIAMGEYSSSFAQPKESYVANMEAIRKLAEQPMLMADIIDENTSPTLAQMHPDLYAQQQRSIAKAVEVMSRYGKPFKPDVLTGKPRYSVSTSESLAYKDAWETAFAPQKFVNDFASGRLNREKWGIAQEVYPELTTQFQFKAMNQLQETQPTLSPTQRHQMSIVLGTRDIMTTGIYQQTYEQAAMSAMPTGQPQGGPPPGSSEPIQKTETLSQQAMAGN